MIGTNGGKVYFSNDNGTKWNDKSKGLESKYVYSILSLKNNVYLGTDKGIYISKNNGEDWTLENTGLSDLSIFKINNVGDYIFASSLYSVFVSTNFGQSWNNKIVFGSNVISIPATFVNGNTFYVGPENDKIMLTTNFGESWGTVSSSYSFGYARAILTFDNYFFVGFDGYKFYQSNNNNKSWVNIDTIGGVTSLLKYNNEIIAGDGYQIYISTNYGDSWKKELMNLPNNVKNDLAIIGDYIYSYTLGFGVYKRKLSDFRMNTSIENELSPKSEILISPNPAQNNLKIKFSNESEKSNLVIIYDILGNKIYEKSISIGTNELDVDLSYYLSGMYLVKNNNKVSSFYKW